MIFMFKFLHILSLFPDCFYVEYWNIAQLKVKVAINGCHYFGESFDYFI